MGSEFPMRSRIELKNPQFEANRQANLERLEALQGALNTANEGGGEKYVQRHIARGKLLQRELADRATTGS